ncbi:MAG TPA: hypothetical protein VIW94_01625 [Acidimicrobiia bacterium]
MNLNLGLGRTLATLLVRPFLIWEAFRAFVAVRAHGGLLPSADYLHWRVHTAYGKAMSETTNDDLREFLAWRRSMREFA